jgi:hypothetical protein|tara:strand:- start:560 stop:739 length:180 start_codon:yes stop_codon:yes gene_type:complete
MNLTTKQVKTFLENDLEFEKNKYESLLSLFTNLLNNQEQLKPLKENMIQYFWEKLQNDC